MADRIVCSFIKSPFEECYVSNMSSSDIYGAIQYCAGNYRECEIYSRHAELDNAGSDARKLRPDFASKKPDPSSAALDSSSTGEDVVSPKMGQA